MKIILGFTGEIGSGKGSACDHIIKKYKGTSHRTSKMLRDLLDRLYVQQTREHMQNISTVLRQIFGEDIMARVTLEDVKNDPNEVVMVDGIRTLADVALLKTLPEFRLIYIDADFETRYQRIKKRDQNPGEKGLTFEEFKAASQRESESHYGELKKLADYIIENNGTVEEFKKKIDDIITEIRSK